MDSETKSLFFYVAPDRAIRPNPRLMPLSAIAKFHDDDGLYFRFAYDPSENKFYIQDGSFRSLLSDGDESAWAMLNQALDAIAKEHGGRMPLRGYGDPTDSSMWRQASDYAQAWKEIVGAVWDEAKVDAVDLPVYEFVPTPDQKDDTISIGDKKGKPFVRMNRFMHRSKKIPVMSTDDVDYELLSTALKAFYLHHMADLVPFVPSKPSAMFAIRQDDKTRVFGAKDGDDGFPFGDMEIRKALDGYDGPILTFGIDKDAKKLTIKNGLLSSIYADETLAQMLKDITSKACRSCDAPSHLMMITCDPCLGLGHVSKLSRHAAAWALAPQEPDMEVLEAPLAVKNIAIIIRDPRDEERQAPRCPAFRASKGMSVAYPFMLVDSRETLGRRTRAMIDTCLRGNAEKEEEMDDVSFALVIATPVVRAAAKADMEMLVSLGYSISDILDFFAPSRDPLRRHEYRKMLSEINEALHGKTVVAAIGKGLNINDWFHGSQEELNRSQHSEDSPKRRPFNMTRRKAPSSAPRSYEQLLMTRHDKELGSYKSMEQLLRESQI